MREKTKIFFYSLLVISILLLITATNKNTYTDVVNIKPSVNLYFFYNNPCDSCKEGEKFYDKFNSIVGSEREGVTPKIFVYNYIKEGSIAKFNQLCNQYKVPEGKRYMPMLFIGNTYISGYDEIEKRLKNEFTKIKDTVLKSNTGVFKEVDDPFRNLEPGNNITDEALSKDTSIGLKASSGEDSVLVYFYISSCSDCSKLSKVLDKLKPAYNINLGGKLSSSNLRILKYNVGKPEYLDLVKKYFKAYNVPYNDQKVPLIFIGGIYKSGGETKLSDIEIQIKNGEGTTTLLSENSKWKMNPEALNTKGYSLVGVFFTGLINGLNPCSLSMLLFFISLLLAKNVNILKFGLLFIAGKFIAYIILGTIAYRLLLLIDETYIRGFQMVLKILLLTVITGLAFANLRDYFAAKDEKYDKIRMQLPKALRKINHSWIKRFTATKNMYLLLLMSFVLGFAISVGEFLCTGQIYLATIIYVLRGSSVLNLQAFSIFVIYVVAMMIPLLLLILAIDKGKEIFDVSEAIRGKLHIIKAINAIVFLIFGIIIFFLF